MLITFVFMIHGELRIGPLGKLGRFKSTATNFLVYIATISLTIRSLVLPPVLLQFFVHVVINTVEDFILILNEKVFFCVCDYRFPFFTEMLWYALDRYVHCLLGHSHLDLPEEEKRRIK
jgi:hypothetical protein